MATTHTGTGDTSAAVGTASGASDIIIQSVTARNLQNNKAKTYASFEVGHHTKNTETNTQNADDPAWEDRLVFEKGLFGQGWSGFDSDTVVKVSVYTKHILLPDHLIGSAEVPLNRVSTGQSTRLELRDKNGQAAGEINFVVQSEGGHHHGVGQQHGVGTTAATGAGVGAAGLGAGALAGHHGHQGTGYDRSDYPSQTAGVGREQGFSEATNPRTGMTATEKVESYVPGTQANKEVKAEKQGAGYDSARTGLGSNQGYGSERGHGSEYAQSGERGYDASNPRAGMSATEKAASYIPGTQANKEAKAEKQGAGYGTGDQGFGPNNQGFPTRSDYDRTDSPALGTGGLAGAVGGAEAGRHHHQHGQPEQFRSGTGVDDTGRGCDRTGMSSQTDTMTNPREGMTAGEKAKSYLPGTEENREVKSERQGLESGLGGQNRGYGGTYEGAYDGDRARQHPGRDGALGAGAAGYGSERGHGSEYAQGGERGYDASNPRAGMSATEKAASYIPGTQANTEVKAETQGTGYDSSQTGLGSNPGAGLGAATGHHHHHPTSGTTTGSGRPGGDVMNKPYEEGLAGHKIGTPEYGSSHIVGAGQGTGHGSQYDQGGERGYDAANPRAGMSATEKAASYIPGTQANKEVKAEQQGTGYDSGRTGLGSNTGYGSERGHGNEYAQSGERGYDASNPRAGMSATEKAASYVPGTQANKEVKAEQQGTGYDSTRSGLGGNQGYGSERGYGSEYGQGGERGYDAANPRAGMSAAEKAASYVPGTQANKEVKAEQQGTGYDSGRSGLGSNTGYGSERDYGSQYGQAGERGYDAANPRADMSATEKAASYVPGTQANKEVKAEQQGTGYDTGRSGLSSNQGYGSERGRGNEYAQGGERGYDASNPRAGMSATEKAASYIPGTQANKEVKAEKQGTGYDSGRTGLGSNPGMGDEYTQQPIGALGTGHGVQHHGSNLATESGVSGLRNEYDSPYDNRGTGVGSGSALGAGLTSDEGTYGTETGRAAHHHMGAGDNQHHHTGMGTGAGYGDRDRDYDSGTGTGTGYADRHQHTGTGAGLTGAVLGTEAGRHGHHHTQGSGVGTGTGYGDRDRDYGSTGTGYGEKDRDYGSTGAGYGDRQQHMGTGAGFTGAALGAETGHHGHQHHTPGSGMGTGAGYGDRDRDYGRGDNYGSSTGYGTESQNPREGMSTVEKLKSYVPGTQENKEVKAEKREQEGNVGDYGAGQQGRQDAYNSGRGAQGGYGTGYGSSMGGTQQGYGSSTGGNQQGYGQSAGIGGTQQGYGSSTGGNQQGYSQSTGIGHGTSGYGVSAAQPQHGYAQTHPGTYPQYGTTGQGNIGDVGPNQTVGMQNQDSAMNRQTGDNTTGTEGPWGRGFGQGFDQGFGTRRGEEGPMSQRANEAAYGAPGNMMHPRDGVERIKQHLASTRLGPQQQM